MSLMTRLYRGETNFDFIGRRRLWIWISGSLLVVSILSLAVRGLNLSVDFEGGLIVEVPNESGVEIGTVRNALASVDQAQARVQLTGGGDIIVQTAALEGAAQDELIAVITDVAGAASADASVTSVGPTFGDEITRRAVQALVIFLGVVALFIAWRFEWKMALAALAALFHDLLITAGIYSVSGLVVTPSTVIAILTILGYSLYDTVVVFDKVTENVNAFGTKLTFAEISNLSMNQVLMRSINTSLTSLLPVGSLLFVGSFLLGATTLREFAFALFIGIAAGTYSSVGVATPVLAAWKETEPDWQRVARRAGRRDAAVAQQQAAEEVAAEAASRRRRKKVVEEATIASGATPRPPKRRKR